MIKSRRAMLVAVLTMLLCLAVVAAGSYALFTDSVSLDNHLQAGRLDITLVRTSLEKTTLDEKGYLTTSNPDTRLVDFSKTNTENALGLDPTEKIVPGSKYVASFEIQNNSDVAFGYWIEIACRDKSLGEELAKQVKITVNTESAFIGEGLVVKASDSSYIEIIDVGGKDSFTVTVEFIDSLSSSNLDDNNLAKGQSIDFDIVVKALQVVNQNK